MNVDQKQVRHEPKKIKSVWAAFRSCRIKYERRCAMHEEKHYVIYMIFIFAFFMDVICLLLLNHAYNQV